MNNFNAHGYSVPEVAQILGVTPCSVRHYINEGKLKADISGEFRKGHKRRIRITKQQLADFMQSRKGYYESNPLYQKLVGSANDIAKKEEKIEEDPFDSYAVKDISELSGAWSPENLKKMDPKENSKKTLSMENTKEKEVKDTLTLLVDGRISIGSIGRSTMITIVTALLSDDKFNPSDIKITLN